MILRIVLENSQKGEEINTRSKKDGRMYTEYGSLDNQDIAQVDFGLQKKK